MRHTILGREITIGRDRSNRICISDHFVSKFHAKLIVHDRIFTLVDLGSANGTRVNGREIRESQVAIGDQIQFAEVSCRLEFRCATTPDELSESDEIGQTLNRVKHLQPQLADQEIAVLSSTQPDSDGTLVSWVGPIPRGERIRFRYYFWVAFFAVLSLIVMMFSGVF